MDQMVLQYLKDIALELFKNIYTCPIFLQIDWNLVDKTGRCCCQMLFLGSRRTQIRTQRSSATDLNGLVAV
jgi:hypothetical protein